MGGSILAYFSIWYLNLHIFQSPWHLKRALPVSVCIPFSFGMIWLAVMLSSIMLCFSSLIPRDIAEGGLLNSSLNSEAPTLCILFLAFQSLQRPLSQEMSAGKKILYLGITVLQNTCISILCNVFWSIFIYIKCFLQLEFFFEFLANIFTWIAGKKDPVALSKKTKIKKTTSKTYVLMTQWGFYNQHWTDMSSHPS